MKKRKSTYVYKLSHRATDASLNAVQERLASLKELISNGISIAEGMHQIARELGSHQLNQRILPTINENFHLLAGIVGNDIGLIKGKHDVLGGTVSVGLVYIKSLTDENLVSHQVLKPLLDGKISANTSLDAIPDLIRSQILYVPNTELISQVSEAIENILSGNTVLFIEGLTIALVIGSRKIEKRAIEKPQNEGTILTGMEAFTEDLDINCSMIIKRLPISALHIESFTVGVLSRTKVQLLWVEGVANAKAITEARSRINRIDIDNVESIGVLAELIEDNPRSIFPQYKQTERPDVITKALTGGCFAIICANNPFAFFAPASFWDNFKTMDDYAERRSSASYFRVIRYLAFLVSILISPLYLSFVAFNQTIVPPSLAINIANGRGGVPFPSGVELLLLTIGTTVIREGSLRMPGMVGFFIGTLAAVVLGQAAVTAGYFSASIIIVVAVAEISAFAITATTLVTPSRLLNYFFILLSSAFGTFGLINGIVIILWHLASLESFGVPYLYPLVPFDLAAMKNTIVRIGFPKRRLRILVPFNRVRKDE